MSHDTLAEIRRESLEAAQAAAPSGITFPAVIDSTMRSDFVSCPHKFYESHILCLRGVESNVHLHFGGCFARGLEVFRKSFWGQASPCRGDVYKSLANAVKAIIVAWGDFRIPSNVPRPAAYKTLEACLDALLSFIEEYPPEAEHIVPLLLDGEPAVEFSFAVPIPGVKHPETGGPILYAGRFDMLAKYGQSSIYIDDEKTTTSLGQQWLNRWKLAAQFTGYIWGANEWGFPAAGALIRGISILSADIGHALVIEQRFGYQIDAFKFQLRRDVERMIRCWNDGYWDHAFDKACSEFGGCAYLGICKSADPDTWRQNFPIRKPWDPLGRPE